MQLQNNTVLVAAIYVAVIGAGAVAAGITSASAWVSVAALVLPAFSMLLIWSQRPKMAPALQVVPR